MDILLAMRYAVASNDAGSFAAAASQLNVTPGAVNKVIGALETKLQTSLFVRSTKGLSPTPEGAQYVHHARTILADVERINLAASEEAIKARGTLILATQPEISTLAALSDFHDTYPEMQMEVRHLTRQALLTTQAQAYLLHGWPQVQDMIKVEIAQTRFVVCAAPSYWQDHGVPAHPNDLVNHSCLLYAVDGLTVNDLWIFNRALPGTEAAGEEESLPVVVNGWLQSNDRPTTIMSAIRGKGIIRISDMLVGDYLRGGQLQPVLSDWTVADPPPIVLLYRKEHRGSPKIRLLVDFLKKWFATQQQILAPNSPPRDFTSKPYWSKEGYGRASKVPRRTAEPRTED